MYTLNPGSWLFILYLLGSYITRSNQRGRLVDIDFDRQVSFLPF